MAGFISFLIVFQFFYFLSTQEATNISYEILSQGQEIEINLQDYFKYANKTQINENKSTANFKQTFVISKNSQPYRPTTAPQKMEVSYKNKTIRLSNFTYYTTKAFYNQPLKIFLLQGNFIMMYIYSQHNDQTNNGAHSEMFTEQNNIIGLNLTQRLPSFLRNIKKVNCTSMETQSTQQNDYIYVMCKAQDSMPEQIRQNYFYLIQVRLIQNAKGFAYDLRIAEYYLLYSCVNNMCGCNEYTLKYFEEMQMDNNTVLMNIFAYCKNKPIGPGKRDNTSIFHFYLPSYYIIKTDNFIALFKCLNNASYISHSENGFLSIINKQINEYYTNQTNRKSECKLAVLTGIDTQFSTSRVYNNIDITYYFLRNNTIIIKSSYRTNYQTIQLNRKGFKMTGFALTQHFMALSLSNTTNSIILVYSLDQLYPRLIDEKTLVNQIGTYESAMLISTNNYLEKGYYVFFYDKYKNQLSLNQYLGYVLIVKPKSQSNKQLAYRSQMHQYAKSKTFFKNNRNIFRKKSANLLLKQERQSSSKVFTIYLQSHVQDTNQQLAINIVVRNFNDPSIAFLPHKQINIDSTYLNFNLSALAIGPVKQFYVQKNKKDKYIHAEYINYYTTINISFILQNRNHCQLPNGRGGVVEKLKQIALNLQLKVLNPIFSLYYTTCIQNCALMYNRQLEEYKLQCHKSDMLEYKSAIQSADSKIIVLTKDKWLQYNSTHIEYCTITGEIGQCELFNMKEIAKPLNSNAIQIIRVKLVSFESKPNGYTKIEIFIISEKVLHYGYFESKKGNNTFNYNHIFEITCNQVEELFTMKLTNVHFDKNYRNFLLLHLSTEEGELIKHTALLYDKPNLTRSKKFLGHLIKVFDNQQIESLMTIDNLIIIIYREDNGNALIIEYKISQFYSVYQTRIYPLYARKVVQNGAHISDGEFLYVEVLIEAGEKAGLTEYLVYCPALTATNVLTHIIPKDSMITFIQQIGKTKNKHPHSIGINGNNIFALSVPNMVIKFDNDHNSHTQKYEDLKYSNNDYNYGKSNKRRYKNEKVVEGNISLKLIDYKNTMHQLEYNYMFDISAEAIKYSPSDSQAKDVVQIQINTTYPNSSYALQLEKIQGPVMEYYLKIQQQQEQNCAFLDKHIAQTDVITDLQCLINIDTKMYGTLLELTTVSQSIGKSVEIIVTTNYIICVENRHIKEKIDIPLTKSCTIASNDKYKVIMVCDEGQGSVIHIAKLTDESCIGFNVTIYIEKPSWLIYQYFKMKLEDQYVIIEVPIRVESNKIYYVTQFDLDQEKFSQKFFSLTHRQLDHFLSKDFDISDGYGYVLEQGLGIYSLDDEDDANSSNTIQPIAWISPQKLSKQLNSSTEFVYFKPEIQLEESAYKIGERCKGNFTNSIHGEIGTITHAYLVKICFNDDDISVGKYGNSIDNEYEIIPIIIFKQYKDCKNNELSKSKKWGGFTIKLCVLQLQDYRIFANYMPISSKSSEYYMQFYATDSDSPNVQYIHPFRMEKVSTNSTFEIKEYEGEIIVRSLFNFLCYYQLEIDVKWTFFMNANPDNQYYRSCNATIVLQNQNYVKEISLIINNTDPLIDQTYKPWIFRSVFIVLSLVSLCKWHLYEQKKKKKYNRLRYNIFSNQFELKVRINSKKSLQVELLGDEREYPDDHGYEHDEHMQQ